jgi:hypothetical protein
MLSPSQRAKAAISIIALAAAISIIAFRGPAAIDLASVIATASDGSELDPNKLALDWAGVSVKVLLDMPAIHDPGPIQGVMTLVGGSPGPVTANWSAAAGSVLADLQANSLLPVSQVAFPPLQPQVAEPPSAGASEGPLFPSTSPQPFIPQSIIVTPTQSAPSDPGLPVIYSLSPAVRVSGS